MPLHLLLTLLAQPALVIQAAPSADALVAQHLEACGGTTRLRAVQSRRIHYRCSALTPFEIPVTVEQKRPCLYRRESSVLGVTQINAFDGVKGWKVDPLLTFSSTPLDLTKSEAQQMDQDSTFDTPLLDYAAKGHRLEYLGQQSLDGRPADGLRITFKSGEAMKVYLDAQTHLAVKWVATERRKDGIVEIATTLGDYRSVEGVAYPHRIEIAPSDGAWHMTLVAEKVESNPVLDDARFAQPGATGSAAASRASK